jgi:hypothetical protein
VIDNSLDGLYQQMKEEEEEEEEGGRRRRRGRCNTIHYHCD